MVRQFVLAASAALLFIVPAGGQMVLTPLEHFGHEIGEDRKLADWGALTSYFEGLAAASGRVKVDTLGVTTAGRPFVMLTITSPHDDPERLSEHPAPETKEHRTLTVPLPECLHHAVCRRACRADRRPSVATLPAWALATTCT